MTFTIFDKELEFNYRSQVGPLYRYECLFGEPYKFDPEKRWPLIKLIYAILWCDNRGLNFTFDEFIDAVEDDVLTELILAFTERVKFFSQGEKDEAKEADEKKA